MHRLAGFGSLDVGPEDGEAVAVTGPAAVAASLGHWVGPVATDAAVEVTPVAAAVVK